MEEIELTVNIVEQVQFILVEMSNTDAGVENSEKCQELQEESNTQFLCDSPSVQG
jgi:hypothetical protein